MSSAGAPESGGPAAGRTDNGLLAASYVPLTDIDAEVGRHLLTALGRARIAAYLAFTDGQPADRRRLYVNADERADARTIVAAAVRALGSDQAPAPPSAADPLAGMDTDRAFAELIADWHVDTVAAIRDAERDLSHEDEQWRARLEQGPVQDPIWLDDDHYVPPAPPPLPRLAGPTVLAVLIVVASVLMLALGGQLGLTGSLTLFLGIGGLLTGAGMLIMRLRADRDEDDGDGAIL